MFIFKYTREELRESVGVGGLIFVERKVTFRVGL